MSTVTNNYLGMNTEHFDTIGNYKFSLWDTSGCETSQQIDLWVDNTFIPYKSHYLRTFYLDETKPQFINKFMHRYSYDANFRKAAFARTTMWALRNEVFFYSTYVLKASQCADDLFKIVDNNFFYILTARNRLKKNPQHYWLQLKKYRILLYYEPTTLEKELRLSQQKPLNFPFERTYHSYPH